MAKGDLFQVHRASSICENPSTQYTVSVIFSPSKTKEKSSMTIEIDAEEKNSQSVKILIISAKQE